MNIIDLDKKDLAWLKKAVNNKSTKEYERYILKTNEGYYYATNGYACHRIYVPEHSSVQNQLFDYNGYRVAYNDEIGHNLLKLSTLFINDNKSTVDRISLFSSHLDTYLIQNTLQDSHVTINTNQFLSAIDNRKTVAMQLDVALKTVYINYENRAILIKGLN